MGGGQLGSGDAFSDVSVACFRGGFRRKRGPLPGGAVGQISDPVFAGGTGFRALTARVARTSGAGFRSSDFWRLPLLAQVAAAPFRYSPQLPPGGAATPFR